MDTTESQEQQPADTDTVTPEPDKAPEPSKPAAEKDWRAEADKWKSLARKHEDQSKANADKAKQFDEITEAQKSELERANDRAAQAEAKAAEIEQRALRAEVAAAKGVPVELLSGSTQEELEASADALLAFRGKPPAPDFGAGDRGGDLTTKVKQLTQSDMKRMSPEQIVEARQKGQFDDLMKI